MKAEIAPKTREYFLQQLNAVQKEYYGLVEKIEGIRGEIQDLETLKHIHEEDAKKLIEKRNILLPLFIEIGGSEHEITTYGY